MEKGGGRSDENRGAAVESKFLDWKTIRVKPGLGQFRARPYHERRAFYGPIHVFNGQSAIYFNS